MINLYEGLYFFLQFNFMFKLWLTNLDILFEYTKMKFLNVTCINLAQLQTPWFGCNVLS